MIVCISTIKPAVAREAYCLGLRHMANYSCKKVFPYNLTFSHNTSVTDDDRRQTDEQTDDTSCYDVLAYSSISVARQKFSVVHRALEQGEQREQLLPNFWHGRAGHSSCSPKSLSLLHCDVRLSRIDLDIAAQKAQPFGEHLLNASYNIQQKAVGL